MPDFFSSKPSLRYSSFTSIDWLHDSVSGPFFQVQNNVMFRTYTIQIKDSRRRSKLRRRKSLRGRIRNVIDRSLGWIVVTIVGILSAILAFLIVRSEQWLFDLKEGKCRGSQWYKAKRFCCPQMASFNVIPITEPPCYNWETWSDIAKAHGIHAEIEHISYIFIAVSFSSSYTNVFGQICFSFYLH